MATITEKVAYLKGLVEGMDIDQSTKEGKVLTAVMDVLSDLATTLEDLDLLESDYYEEWEEDDDYCDGCCDDCDEDCGDEFYDVTCPSCDTTFCVDEETLLEGGIECPNCGENLEFEIEEDEIEEED